MSTVQNYPNLQQGSFSFLKCIYLWLCWVLVAAWASLGCREQGLPSRCGVQAPHCRGLSCCEPRLEGAWASGLVACELSGCSSWALEHRPNSCGAGAQLLCGTWNLPGPVMEPESPALAGGFFATEQPGKPVCVCIYVYIYYIHSVSSLPNTKIGKEETQKWERKK